MQTRSVPADTHSHKTVHSLKMIGRRQSVPVTTKFSCKFIVDEKISTYFHHLGFSGQKGQNTTTNCTDTLQVLNHGALDPAADRFLSFSPTKCINIGNGANFRFSLLLVAETFFCERRGICIRLNAVRQ